MYTLHKSIIAFLLFFITTILACAPVNENATDWTFGPKPATFQNISLFGPNCDSVDIQLSPDNSAIEIYFSPMPYVRVGPGLPPDEAYWECIVSFKLNWLPNWRPVVLDTLYEVVHNLDNDVISYLETYSYIGAGPADLELRDFNSGPSGGIRCVGDFLTTPQSSPCGTMELPITIHTKLNSDNSQNLNGFGYLQVNNPHYLGLDWQLC
ncbi:hypothetical protein BDZ91DRAFT_797201 [Kalaharituber pfeilii]|nr:hypothetical protein BDZ91DRAFT_797201 [Kalaharituber pfeilii]